jgi:hypothetical protein
MWGINGQYCFVAEEAGATRVVGVDVDLATPEFEATRTQRNSKVEFVHGDVGDPRIVEELGGFEVVFCSGVLYHHPSPFDLLVALRRITTETLILTTATIPEVPGLPQAAVYYPNLSTADRSPWDLHALTGGRMIGISEDFQPDWGYANWFWGMSPSCVRALLETAGFTVTEDQALWEFGHLFVCEVARDPIEHRLPERTAATS